MTALSTKPVKTSAPGHPSSWIQAASVRRCPGLILILEVKLRMDLLLFLSELGEHPLHHLSVVGEWIPRRYRDEVLSCRLGQHHLQPSRRFVLRRKLIVRKTLTESIPDPGKKQILIAISTLHVVDRNKRRRRTGPSVPRRAPRRKASVGTGNVCTAWEALDAPLMGSASPADATAISVSERPPPPESSPAAASNVRPPTDAALPSPARADAGPYLARTPTPTTAMGRTIAPATRTAATNRLWEELAKPA
jgi:hypothetical protein